MVFGIQVGVSIAFLIRKKTNSRKCTIFLHSLNEYWTRYQKCDWLDRVASIGGVEWTSITPDPQHNWKVSAHGREFRELTPLAASSEGLDGIFATYSNGVQSNRDPWVFNFNREHLEKNASLLVSTYNAELDRWNRSDRKPQVDAFVSHDDKKIKWCSKLKQLFEGGIRIEFNPDYATEAQYRPFTKQWLYFDPKLLHRPGQIAEFFPPLSGASANPSIIVTPHSQVPFSAQALDRPPCLDVGGRPSQCFPFYVYEADSADRHENITDWALEQFRQIYKHRAITKWQIFHYVYAVLHHTAYRERYSASFHRELPRIPFAPDFPAFAQAGERLARLHVDYDKQAECKLEHVEKPGERLDFRVEKMRLGLDKTAIVYNEFLTLKGIPPETHDYRLGNRSALDWVIAQHQISTDKRTGITNDPNRADDPEYILRLIGQVITVSLETSKIVRSLPKLGV